MEDNEDSETEHTIFDGTSLEDAKAFVQRHLHDGVSCPACGQFCKVYKRPINSTMAFALCRIYQHFAKYPNHVWLHIPQFLTQVRHASLSGGDVVKLRYWGLIERVAGTRDDGSDRIGCYRITEVGKQFVEGRVAVPKYVYLYNQLLLRLSEEMTTIREALGEKFKYDELMRTTS